MSLNVTATLTGLSQPSEYHHAEPKRVPLASPVQSFVAVIRMLLLFHEPGDSLPCTFDTWVDFECGIIVVERLFILTDSFVGLRAAAQDGGSGARSPNAVV